MRKPNITVVGLGAIGSRFVRNVVSNQDVSCLTLIDFDRVESKNILTGQNYDLNDVGQFKARATAKKVTCSHLNVNVFCEHIEDIPLGSLRDSILVSCVDNRRSRLRMSQLAFRLGIPFIDAGVNSTEQLIRVTIYDPSFPGAPCVQCQFGTSDYENLEQVYPCLTSEPVGDNVPRNISAIAAVFLTDALDRVLNNQHRIGETLFSLNTGRFFQLTSKRSKRCHFNHKKWSSPIIVSNQTRILSLLPDKHTTLVSPTSHFVTRVFCSNCSTPTDSILRIYNRLGSMGKCEKCGSHNIQSAFFCFEEISSAHLMEAAPLHSLGLEHNDIILVRSPEREDTAYQIEDTK